STWRLVRDRPLPTVPLLLRACLLPVLIGTAFLSRISEIIYYTLSSPAVDLPLFVWAIVLFLKFADYMLTEQPRSYAVFELCALAAVGVTMKLSMLVFGGAIIVIALAAWLYRNTEFRQAGRQSLLYLSIIGFLVICPWMVRGIILSGYPVYPATVGGMNVDWQVPPAEAEGMKHLISNWSKTWTVQGSENWIAFWLKQYSAQPMFTWPLWLLAASLLVLVCFLKGIRWNARQFIVWLPTCAAVVFLFVTAPNPRFLGPALWLLALWPLAGAIKLLLDIAGPQKRFVAYCAFAVIQAALIIGPLKEKSPHYSGKIPRSGFCKIPEAPLKKFNTRFNLTVWIPETGGQTWDAPLPAAPFPRPRLAARGATLADGFRFVPRPPPKPANPSASPSPTNESKAVSQFPSATGVQIRQ
ncbi:MAG TPA: hypothetical protein VJ063_03690, partial [Verrucomicrobiae bacterium]|nr:hypothetical protein [Verrucomicrobiae bacterium]